MKYKLYFSEQASSEIEKLDNAVKLQLMKKIAQLGDNLELGKPLSHELKNERSLRVGKYRVIYSVKGGDVIIARVRHRKFAYYYF